LHVIVLCNGAELRQEDQQWMIIGDPTEGALLVAAAKVGLWKRELERAAPFLGEVPFDPERKKMTIVRETPSGPTAFVKGAPDVLLRDCSNRVSRDGSAAVLTDQERKEILGANQRLAGQALRVLGVAMRPLAGPPVAYEAAALECELTFLGLVGMKDPVRPEAKVAVEICRAAGIRTVMITGDHQETAVAIARELGIMEPGMQAISGTDLDRLADDELARQVSRFAVYARVSAEHKLKVVRAWRQQGAVVAMTGDGVNDAPAVKEADIGVAMGISGTAVTKEASDMVVTDDNFASIAAAVEVGRGIYDNIRKAVHYLLSCNISEVLVMLLAALVGLPLPLLPVQILWINLVTDGLPALALAVDPAAPDLMRRRPRDPRGRILDRSRIAVMLAQGFFMALLTLGVFACALYGMDRRIETARTLAFTVLVFAQLAHAFNCRSDRYSLFRIGWGTNPKLLWAVGGSALLQVVITLHPWTREVFKAAMLTPAHWALAVGVGLLPLLAMEGWKRVSAST
jgi:Ca2+-transporting ATPase